MARKKTNNLRHWQKYPNTYARTSDTWTTRYYNRKSDPIFNLLGLSTAPDDYHKPDGSSPFLTNVRYMGEREEGQRAQVMSRKGARLVAALGESVFDRTDTTADSYIDIKEGKAIEFELTHSRRLTGMSLHLMNANNAVGALEITIRHPDTRRELANAVIILDDVNKTRFENYRVRFMKAVAETRVIVRLRVIDSLTDDERENGEVPKGLSILAISGGRHRYADYDLPNIDDALQEKPYEWHDAPLIPMAGTIVNDWKILNKPEEFRTKGERHLAVPVQHDGVVEIFGINLVTETVYAITSLVSTQAKSIRFAQAEGYLYYVDGISPLRRINLTTMLAENAVPVQSEITVPGVNAATLTAKAGASLIHYLNNRLYLSGFKDDPNLVINSLIDATKPRFTQFNDRFYSPDQSPELSTDSPITALTDINDYLIVFRNDGLSAYDYGAGVSASDARQVTPEGAQIGVASQDAVVKARNNIYFFNKVEGLVRFAGSVNRVLTGDIDNLMSRIKNPEHVALAWDRANEAVRVYCSFDGQENDRCLFYYAGLEGRLPWYSDIDTPVVGAVTATESDQLYGFHSQVANVFVIDDPDQYTDFDSYIVLEYHTQYRTPPTADPSGWTYLRRLHLHELRGRRHATYLAIDTDHKDKPTVWRRFIDSPVTEENNEDAVFQQTAEPGTTVISISMLIKCTQYQVRFKRYCYRDSGETQGVSIEYGNKSPI